MCSLCILVQQELERKMGGRVLPARRGGGIPHLQLFWQLTELPQYKVTDVLDRKIIIAHRLGCGEQQQGSVVFKVLHKSAAVYKRNDLAQYCNLSAVFNSPWV